MKFEDVELSKGERRFYRLLNFLGRWSFRLTFIAGYAAVVFLSIQWGVLGADASWVKEDQEIQFGDHIFEVTMAQMTIGMSLFYWPLMPFTCSGWRFLHKRLSTMFPNSRTFMIKLKDGSEAITFYMLAVGLVFLAFYSFAGGWISTIGWPLLTFTAALGLWVIFSSIWGLGIDDQPPTDAPSKFDRWLYKNTLGR